MPENEKKVLYLVENTVVGQRQLIGLSLDELEMLMDSLKTAHKTLDEHQKRRTRNPGLKPMALKVAI